MQKPGSPAKPGFSRVRSLSADEAGAEVAGAGAVAGEVFEAAPGLGGGVEHGGEVEGVVVELAGVAGEEGFGRGAEDGGEDAGDVGDGAVPAHFGEAGFVDVHGVDEGGGQGPGEEAAFLGGDVHEVWEEEPF